MVLAQTKANNLIKELTDIFDSDSSLDEFSLHRYLKDIDAIKRINYAQGLFLEALVAGITNDIQTVLAIAEKGFNSPKVDFVWYTNIINLLKNLGKVVEAYAMSIKALQLFPTEIAFAQIVLHFALAFDDEKTLAEVSKLYSRELEAARYLLNEGGREAPEEAVAAVLSGIMSIGDFDKFSQREVASIESLLEGVEVD